MNTKPITALYIKEIKSNYKIFLALLILQIMYIFLLLDINVFHVFITISDPRSINADFVIYANLMLYLSITVLTGIFLYSWYNEEKSKTNYQLLSLPGRSHSLLKSKIMALSTMGMIWIFGIILFYFLLQTFDSFESEPVSPISWIFLSLKFFSNLILLMGISCIIVGLVKIVKSYRFLLGMLVFIALSYTFFLKLIPLFRYLLINFTTYPIRDFLRIHHQLTINLYGLVSFLIPIILGIACMYVGFFLFEKYSEV